MPMPDPKPLEAKLKNIPLANATLAQTLATQGYFESNRPFHPKDLDVVLSDYLELKGEIKVINGNQYTWHDPRDPTAKRELQNQIRLAFETKQRVLIPINNGSGHYVCIDIEKLPDGRKTAYLIDSMAEMKVSQQHKKSNQELIKLVTEALPPGAVVTPLYTRQQQDNATCPYYAVRYVVKACASDPERPLDGLYTASEGVNIDKFAEAMARKVFGRSTAENKAALDKDPETLTLDPFGTLVTRDGKNNPAYQNYIAQRDHVQFSMGLETYKALHALNFELSFGKNEARSAIEKCFLDEKIQMRARALTPMMLAKAIKLFKSPPPDSLKAAFNDLRDKITVKRDSGEDRMKVDDVSTEKNGILSCERYQLRTAPVRDLKIEEHKPYGFYLTLSLGSVEALGELMQLTSEKEQFENTSKIIQQRIDESKAPLCLLEGKNQHGQIILTLRHQNTGASIQDLLLELQSQLLYDQESGIGIFGERVRDYLAPVIDRALKDQQEQYIAARPAAKPKEESTEVVFTVIQGEQVTGRTQIIARPGVGTPAPAAAGNKPPRNLPEEDRLLIKYQEIGRRQIDRWLEKPPSQEKAEVKDHKPDSVVTLNERNQVCVKQYLASKNNAENKFLKGSDLLQCAVMETCLIPGQQTQVKLILPPKTQLVKPRGETSFDANNFNTLVFDFIHRAVQEALQEQSQLKQPGANTKPFIKLDQVYSLDFRLTKMQLALMRYCYFMDIECQTAKGECITRDQLGARLKGEGFIIDLNNEPGQMYYDFMRFTANRPFPKKEDPVMKAGDDFVTPPERSFTDSPPLSGFGPTRRS